MKTHFIKWGVAPLVAMIATGLHRLGIVDHPATVLFTAATPLGPTSRHCALADSQQAYPDGNGRTFFGHSKGDTVDKGLTTHAAWRRHDEAEPRLISRLMTSCAHSVFSIAGYARSVPLLT